MDPEAVPCEAALGSDLKVVGVVDVAALDPTLAD